MHVIEIKSLLENYDKIVHAFGKQEYLGKVHSLETPSEGLCSFYYIELKLPYPESKELQFAVLWKLLELNESQSDYRRRAGSSQEEMLRENFQYILDSWEPRQLEEKDILRAKEIMLDCQDSFAQGSPGKAWLTQRQVGYYLNNKYMDSVFPSELVNKITNTKNKGIVIYDVWNDLTILFESKSVLSMFYWATFA